MIDGRDGAWKIVPQKSPPDRSRVDDLDRVIAFPPGTSIDEVCERMVALGQAAMQKWIKLLLEESQSC